MSDGNSERRRLFEQEALPHLNSIYSMALHLTRHENDAKDLCQEVFSRAYRRFNQFTPGANCRAWLLAILFNTFQTNYRRARREQVAGTTEEFERALSRESCASESSNVSSRREIYQAMESLPEDFRVALLLVDVYDLRYKDAALVLDAPIGTVRSHIALGRALLRKALGDLAKPRRLASI